MGLSTAGLEDRLLRRRQINPATGCWEWQGSRLPKGYGWVLVSLDGKLSTRLVHRVAMTLWRGFDLCSGLLVCHRCDNPRCFNPEHLFLGSKTDNAEDAKQKGRLYRGGADVPAHGSGHYRAKLTEDLVLAAKCRYRAGASLASLAQEYGVVYSVLYKAVRGLTWKHVKGTEDATHQAV